MPVYSLILFLYRSAIGIASLFSPKARLWIAGRKAWRSMMKEALKGLQDKPIWVHVSSVGEYEQGKPLLEKIRKERPDVPLVLTFFSPSGYELLKERTEADHVFYLPLDGPMAARDFLDIVNPRWVLFVKYEFWYFYFKELHQRKIPFALISAKLRRDQFFFQWYGRAYRRILKFPSHYFVQDAETKNLLNESGIANVTLTGDTRVDRVSQVTKDVVNLPLVQQHVGDKKVLVLGSAWKQELDFVAEVLNNGIIDDWKVIVAPHEIDLKKIEEFEKKFSQLSLRYTLQEGEQIDEDVPVLIIDCVGILKQVYKYCDLALIGGGFGDGIHNILEPAAFGVPSIFGPKHEKFPEAAELMRREAGWSVKSISDFRLLLEYLVDQPQNIEKASEECRKFIAENVGATDRTWEVISSEF